MHVWGKVVYGNASVYEGVLVAGHPQGHGVKKEGKFMGSGAAVYTREWDAGLKQGYGVLEDICFVIIDERTLNPLKNLII